MEWQQAGYSPIAEFILEILPVTLKFRKREMQGTASKSNITGTIQGKSSPFLLLLLCPPPASAASGPFFKTQVSFYMLMYAFPFTATVVGEGMGPH